MYITTTKAKRYWQPYISFSNSGEVFDLNKALAVNFHPDDSIAPIYKRRPNTVDTGETTSGRYYYLMSEVVHKIVLNKDDIKTMLQDENNVTISRWSGLYEILPHNVCKYYNKLNNTTYSHCNNSGYCSLQAIDWISNNSDNLEHFADDLPDDWQGWVEVFLFEDFKLITNRTASELKYIENKQRQEASIALHKTFLKDEMNKICEELGLYYEERTNSYKFEVQNFRGFMLKAVQQLICDKLKEHGINIEPSQDIKKIRSTRVMIDYLHILDVGDLKMEE